MLTIATTEAPGAVNWIAYLLILVAAGAFSYGLRRLSSMNGRHRVRRWVPAVHVLIWAIALAVIVVGVAAQGFTTALFLVLLAITGVVIAGMGWLRSVIAGLVLFSEAELAVGDRIEVGGHRGEVIRIGVRSVRLCDVDGVIHDIPHDAFIGQPITRFTDAADAACEFVMEFDTDEAPAQLLETVRIIASIAPLASPRRKPQVYLDEPPRAGEPIMVRIRSYPFSPDRRRDYRSDLMRRLHRRFGG